MKRNGNITVLILNLETKFGITPGNHIRYADHLKVFPELLARGANINKLLFIASFNGKREVGQYLLSKGANISVVDKLGRNPLFLAVEGQHTGLISPDEKNWGKVPGHYIQPG